MPSSANKLTGDGDDGGIAKFAPLLHIGLNSGEGGGPGEREHDRTKR